MADNKKESDDCATIDLTKSSSSETLVGPSQKPSTSLPSPSPMNLASPKSNDIKASPEQHAKNRRKKKPTKVAAINTSSDFNSDFSSSPINPLVSSAIVNDSKFDSDDDDDGCETIDKIAQMVSSITQTAIPLLTTSPTIVAQPPASTVAASAPIPQTSTTLNDVEDQLKEMFGESSNALAPEVDVETKAKDPEKKEDIAEVTKTTAPAKPKKPRKKKPNENAGQKKQARKAGGANDSKSKKNNDKTKGGKGNDKKEKGADLKKAKTKENGGKSRVKNEVAPFLQIQKDGSFQIVNQTANGDDDAEKSTSKPKKLPSEKHKNIRGLHVSTLSNKYDADKRDTTWVCVFCKMEPHKFKLGDLFGPYFITKTSTEYALCLEDPANDVFRQGNANKFVPFSPPIITSPTKKKRKISVTSPVPSTSTAVVASNVVPDYVFNGMTKIDDNHFEIWFHEDCLVWAPGTYIIGSKVNGLEAAVWQSTRHLCSSCGKNGAMVACLFRGCKKEAHYVCARKSWKLCDDFKTYCELHSQ